jgi:t-SNARE complex subunit (syntaxin)
MNRLSDFQRAAEAAQLNQKAQNQRTSKSSDQPTGGNALYQPFQKSSAMEKGEAINLSHLTVKEGIPPPPIITKEDAETEMPRFFVQINEIKEANKRVKTFTEEIEKLHKAALSTADSQESADLSSKIEALMAKVSQMSNKTRRTLQEMNSITKELMQKYPKSSGNLRMRESNHRQASKAFMEAMRSYQKMQETYQSKYRDQIQRQYLIVKPRATKAELAELTKDPEAMKIQVFAMSVKEDSKKTLGQMKNRLQDMQNIEKSILDLNQMFLQMQDLVVSQGEIINRIEYNVDQIEDYTAQAAKNMENALESQKAIQKKKWYIILIVMAIFGIVIVCVLLSVIVNFLPTFMMLKIFGK